MASYVAGALPFNDVSARDLQLQNPLWTSGKAIDTFAPCGPALVTLDEVGDLGALELRTRINGEVLQQGTTANMIFGFNSAICCSRKGRHSAASLGLGSRLPGGRHFNTFAMYTCSRANPMARSMEFSS